MEILLICLIIGILLGRIGIVGFLLDDILLWYQNKYSRFTHGDGRNYMQIFRQSVKVRGGKYESETMVF